MDPKLKKAFVKAIKHYFDDKDFAETSKGSPERKFNKKYFDSLEEEFVPKKETSKKKIEKLEKQPGGKY